MGQIDKKADEQKVIDAILGMHPRFKDYEIVKNEERPDFIISNGTTTVGLEHCLIDTMLDGTYTKKKNKPPASLSKQFEKCAHDLSVKYKNMSIADIENEAIGELEKFATRIFNATSQFEQRIFEYKWTHVVLSHAIKTAHYREAMPNNSELGLVCEVPLPHTGYDWLVQMVDEENFHKQRICGLPITYIMWAISILALQKNAFDFIIIVTRSLNFKDIRIREYRQTDLLNIPIYCGFKPDCLYDSALVSMNLIEDKTSKKESEEKTKCQ